MTVLADVLRAVALVGFFMFCFVYHFLAPWWRTEIGRNLMTWAAAPALLLGLGMVARVWPGMWGLDLLRLVVFAVLIVGVYRRTALLLKAQRGSASDEEKEGS